MTQQAQPSMRITSISSDVTLAALQALLQHKSGVFVVRIHNYQVVEVAPVERGMTAADFAALIGRDGRKNSD